MLPVTAPTPVERGLPRPRARSIGLVLLVSGLASLPLVHTQPVVACGSWTYDASALTHLMLVAILLAAGALILQLPKTSAAAPALALGASLPLLGGAAAGWIWLVKVGCASATVDQLAVSMVVQTASALAVAGCSAWLLYARDELEPWYGTRGVVLSSIVGLSILFIGLGSQFLETGGFSNMGQLAFLVSGPVVWSVIAALAGWLRRTPAITLMVCPVIQLVWVLRPQ